MAEGDSTQDTRTHERVYSTQDIQVLEGLEAVRRRPGMYLGNVHDGTALHHMLWEVVDNSLNEHLAGFGSHIEMALGSDGSVTVTDRGRGIPVAIDPERDLSVAEVVMTRLHAGGRFNNNTYAIKTGSYGVGVSAVNAVSETLTLEIWREGTHWRQRYVRGIPQEPLTDLGATTRTGTRIALTPDLTIFQEVTRLDPERIKARLRELAALCPGLTLELHHDGQAHVEHRPSGLSSLVADAVGDEPALLPMVARFVAEEPCESGGEIRAEVALQWCNKGAGEAIYLLNGKRFHGGTPVRGLHAGMMQAIRRQARARGVSGDAWKAVAPRIAEHAVIALQLWHPSPTYGARTRDIMVNDDAGKLLRRMMATQVHALLAEHPDALTKLLAR